MNKTTEPQTMYLVPQPQWKQVVTNMEKLLERFEKIDPNAGLKSKEFIPMKEALQRFGMKQTWVNDMRRKGLIKTYRVGSKLFVKPHEIKELFESCKE